MHIQTHILSGWCVGNLFPLNPRQRVACMIAAAIADVDGLGILVPGPLGQRLYWDYHHVLAHNLPFGTLISVALVLWCRRRWLLTFATCLALFHLHLVMDYWGSGRDWCIDYLWPFGKVIFRNPYAWDLYSWQNMVAFGLLLFWTIAITRWQRRTPLELLMPSLDRDLAQWARRPRTNPPL
jgi:hypothetical protein